MKGTFFIVTLSLIVILPIRSKAQYIGHFIENDHIKKDTLMDYKTGTKFIIDKKRVFVIAINRTGKVLWKTDPIADNKIEKYRVKRPTIIYFEFGVDNSGKNQVLHIAYNNSQFGYLDKNNGHFYFQGQD